MERRSERAAGDRIGPYVLVRPLGAGGAGEVWEAVLHGPSGFRKAVALKLLRAGPASAALRASLVREARLGALLHHPNVVGTLHLGEHDGVWCVALELVQGASVNALWRHFDGKLPAAAVVEIGVQAAAGLHHVHTFRIDGREAGLVHRDVKPGNLLVDRSGLVKVADLGASIPRGEAGTLAGTTAYMAPEQAGGNPEAASDVWGLGATLYTVATGRRPFGTGARAVAEALRVEALLAEPTFLAGVDAAVPGLGRVVRSCLRLDPGERPSARALGDALAALRSGLEPGPTLHELLVRAWPELADESAPTPVSDLRTVRPQPGNLRVPRDAFVGREGELAELVALADAERWVVVVGPGGMGKTRLALEAAGRIQPRVAGGVFVFDLTSAGDAEGICATIARTLGLELDPRDPVGQLGQILRAKGKALVVLDNLEQCVRALEGTVGRWLHETAECTFLGTSRVVPGLAGERVLGLGALEPPDAVALFHARAPRPLAEAERAHVDPLCRAIEGMPLAIELAAARLRVLDVGSARARLSLDLLGGGGAERPERHRSVRASLAWSYELLSAAGRRALAAMSVFEAPFDTAAAEAVLDGWALDVLQELAEASLVRVDPAAGRFRLPVVVREFAASVLPPEERALAEVRHGDHFAQLGAQEALAALDGPGGTARYRALAASLDDLVAACRRARARGTAETATGALCAADAVLTRQGPGALRVALTREVLAMPGLSAADRARTAARAGGAMFMAGREAEALACYELSITLHREIGDRQGEATMVSNVASLLVQHRPDEAQALHERALALHREVGNRRSEGVVVTRIGILHFRCGRPELARAHFERSLALHREVGNRRWEGVVLSNLGNLELEVGRPAQAQACFEGALVAHREVGNRRSEGIALASLGLLHSEQGRGDEARACYEQGLAVTREVGDRQVEAHSLANLGVLALAEGRTDEALARFEVALAMQREAMQRRAEGSTLVYVGRLRELQGRLDDARALYDEAIAVLREVGDRRQEGIALREVARLSGSEALLDEAEALLRETRAPAELALALAVRAEGRVRSGRRDEAARVLDEAAGLAPWHAGAVREVARVRGLLG